MIGNMQIEQLSTNQLKRLVKQAVYNLTVAALLEKGEAKRDLLAVRDEMRDFLKKLRKGNASLLEVYSELGFALISIAILKMESRNEKVKDILTSVEESFY
jgi:predicted ATPase